MPLITYAVGIKKSLNQHTTITNFEILKVTINIYIGYT